MVNRLTSTSEHGLIVRAILSAAVFLAGCAGGKPTVSNPVPTVASFAPTSATAGGAGFDLNVTGTNFVTATLVHFNGAALATTFVDDTHVRAAVPASALTAGGIIQVTATNPEPGGGSSASTPFTINNPAPAIASLSQNAVPAGSASFSLTVTGSNFVSTSVVQWNGGNRVTSFGSGSQLTAAIPSSDLAFAGPAQVSIFNPGPGGGSSTLLAFTVNAQVANGTALPGDPTSLALNATSDVLPVSVEDSDVLAGIIMNRLDICFAENATVGQVNDALASVGAGIVSMSKNFNFITIGIPLQSSLADVQGYIDKLESSPGIVAVSLGHEAQPLTVFSGTTAANLSIIRHLLPGRFPAAWNVAFSPDIPSSANTFGNPASPVADGSCFNDATPVLVGDFFDANPPSGFTGVVPPFRNPPSPASGLSAANLQHGYNVASSAISNAVGANPFPFSGCEPFQPVQLGGHFTVYQDVDFLAAAMPSGKFIMNYSIGFSGDVCAASPCRPPSDAIRSPFDRAIAALHWKKKTMSRWPDFLMVVAGGNERGKESAGIYAGVSDARFDAPMNIAELADPTFSFVNDDSLWTPPPAAAAQGFVSLKPSSARLQSLQDELARVGPAVANTVADNVITVGSTTSPPSSSVLTAHITPDQLTESLFSDRNPDVLAVGEDVFNINGTSFAAPQVAGLASYLWMISPQLRGMPSSATRHAIVDNTRNKFIDAYASVLSLDPAAAPNGQNLPIRQRLLDVNNDQIFNEKDIEIFLRHFFVVDATGITHQAPPAVADFSRYDLNGDGFTTSGSFRERFDLDRIGSTQFGQTSYSNISQTIEGQEIRFDENEVTDLEILCYYSYSGLFQGDSDKRKGLLAGRCGLSVQPAKVTLATGQTQQFTATLPSNDPVSWSASCGQISQTGLYTAGQDAGPCTVRATDVNDSSISGTAEVDLTFGFQGEEFISADISAFDNSTGNPVFPEQFGTSDNEGSGPIIPPPVTFIKDSTFQGQGANPSHFVLSANSDGPIAALIAPSGTFTGTVACSATGATTTDGEGHMIFAQMPVLQPSMAGSFSLSVVAGHTLAFSVGGTMSRGSVNGVGRGLSLVGLVDVEFTDQNGVDQDMQFELNDGTFQTGNTPPMVPFSVSANSRNVSVRWSLHAHCFQDPGPIDAARGASISLSYNLSQQ